MTSKTEKSSFDKLTTTLTRVISKLPGTVSVKIIFIDQNQHFAYNENTQIWAASVIKVPIACEFYKKLSEENIDPNERIIIHSNNYVDGSGVLKLLNRETSFTYKDLATLMLTLSDNTATNQIVDIIGIESVEEYMHELGLKNTTFRHKMMIKAGNGPNLTTADDMANLLLKLYNNEIPGAEEILHIMEEQIDRTRIPLLLPNDIKVAHKFGALPEASHEIGIVYAKKPFIFCYLTDDQKDKRFTNEILSLCAKICFDYANK